MSPSSLVRSRRGIRTLVYAVSAVAVTAAAGAQKPSRRTTPQSAPVRGPSVEGITQYTLANGLKVLLFPDASKPQTTVSMTVEVGSASEGYGETGMAHLLEHMTYKGSPKHPNPSAELTAHGADFNGSTEFDRTNYFATFAAADSNLAWALDLEADRLVNASIAQAAWDKEYTVVRNEFEMNENDPINVTINHLLGAAYQFHAYKHLPIGSRSDIEHVPVDRLRAFYHKYYQPDNTVLVIAGKFDEKRALDLVQKTFGAIPRPTRTLEQNYTVEPTQDGRREVTIRRAGGVQVLMGFYHVPGGAHPDWPAIDVLTRVLGDAPNGRLYQALVASKLAAGAGAMNLQQHDPGGLIVFAQLKKEQSLDSARAAMLSAIEQLATTKPPTQEEVDRAKTNLLKGFDLLMAQPHGRRGMAVEMSEWIKRGDWRLFFVHRDNVKKVTAKDVQRVAQQYLKESNSTLAQFIPTDKPDRSEIAATPNVDSIVNNYRSTEVVAAGEAFDPTPANVESRVRRSTLPSGMKVALLSKKNRGEAVNASITLRVGNEQALTNKVAVASLTASMLMRGTKSLTRQQLQDSLDKLKARVNVMPSANFVRVLIETTRPNLPAVLRLAADVLHNPAFDQKEFDQLQAQQVAGLEQARTEPTALGVAALQQALMPYPAGHPRHVNTPDEMLAQMKAATVADLRTFHDQLYGTSAGELVVVGDFDAAEIAKEAGALFGSWTSQVRFAPLPEAMTAVTPAVRTIETPDKANALYITGTNFGMKDSDRDYAAFLVADYIMGGSPLDARIAGRVRQKDGLSYDARSIASIGSIDPVAHWMAYAIANPANVQKVEADFADELQKAVTAGFTADEVEKAKSAVLQSRRVARSNDAGLVGTLGADLYLGRTMQFDAALDAAIAALTPADVSAAFRKAIDPAKMVAVKAGDFNKAALSGEKKP